jgi:hypothetical protein
MTLSPWEWEQGAAECIMAIKASARKRGFDFVEVWADYAPDVVQVHWSLEPVNSPKALYRGRTK